MRRAMLMLAMLLAGCSGASTPFQPGEWESTLATMVPDASSDIEKEISAAAPSTHRFCVTPQQASRPSEVVSIGAGEGCVKNVTIANGRIDGTLQCDVPGGSMRSTLDGTYTSTSYEFSSRLQATEAGRTRDVLTQRVTARRIGHCAGSEQGNAS